MNGHDQIPGQMTVDEVIRQVEIEILTATQDPVSACIGTCEHVADCEIHGYCLLRCARERGEDVE